MEWLKRQGPWSPGLIDYLKRHHKQYDALIFFTYLYAPTVLGLQIDPGQKHPGSDRPRRAADSSRHLQGRVPPSEGRSATSPRSSGSSSPDTSNGTPSIEETVGCGVELPPHHAYPRSVGQPSGSPDDVGQEPTAAAGEDDDAVG